ncbi:hypothetical protein [Streptomyces sp. NPDC001068]|uniref:hypothetical protein n=1 Tax=Streptomyces sp. NPDC001068 TaxID=3364544 RepID=UPI0036784B8E
MLHVDAAYLERVVQEAHEAVDVVVVVADQGVAAGLPLLDDGPVRAGEGLGGGQGGGIPGAGRLGGGDQRLAALPELRPLPREHGEQAPTQGLQVLPCLHARGELADGDVGEAVAHGAEQVFRAGDVLADAVRQGLAAVVAAGQVVPSGWQGLVHLVGGGLGGLLGHAQQAAEEAGHPLPEHRADTGDTEAGGHQLGGAVQFAGELLGHLLQDRADLRRYVLLGGGQGLLQLIHERPPARSRTGRRCRSRRG